jgi:hypothetical protein
MAASTDSPMLISGDANGQLLLLQRQTGKVRMSSAILIRFMAQRGLESGYRQARAPHRFDRGGGLCTWAAVSGTAFTTFTTEHLVIFVLFLQPRS